MKNAPNAQMIFVKMAKLSIKSNRETKPASDGTLEHSERL
jgi:hypothetical protein